MTNLLCLESTVLPSSPLASSSATLEQSATTEHSGSGTYTTSFAPEQVFAILERVDDYPAWLPPVGRFLSLSTAALEFGSRLRVQPRKKDLPVMTLEVTAFESGRLLGLLERGEHAHRLHFSLEPVETGTQITVTVGRQVQFLEPSVASPSSRLKLEESVGTLARLGETIAKKLDMHLWKGPL